MFWKKASICLLDNCTINTVLYIFFLSLSQNVLSQSFKFNNMVVSYDRCATVSFVFLVTFYLEPQGHRVSVKSLSTLFKYKVGLGSGLTLVRGRVRIWVWLKSGVRVSRVHRSHQIIK